MRMRLCNVAAAVGMSVCLAIGGMALAGDYQIHIRHGDGGFRLEFPEQSSASEYLVDRRTDLLSGGWQAATESDTVSPGGSGEITVPLNVATGSVQFFRVRAVVLPPLPPAPSDMVLVACSVAERGNVLGDVEGPAYTGSVVDVTLRAGDEVVCTNVVPDLFVDVTETTKAQWDYVASWATNHGYVFGSTAGGVDTNHPVYGVRWFDCLKWANARSQMEGFEPCYRNSDGGVYMTNETFDGSCDWRADGYRLPTEAEWEWAARGGASGHRFPWSDVETIDFSRANYRGGPSRYSYDVASVDGYNPSAARSAFPYTLPVASFAPNGYGLYDMAGNVYEWCWDYYVPDGYAGVPNTALAHGPAKGLLRVARGGCWRSTARTCRVASRHAFYPGLVSSVVGFRLVRRAR